MALAEYLHTPAQVNLAEQSAALHQRHEQFMAGFRLLRGAVEGILGFSRRKNDLRHQMAHHTEILEAETPAYLSEAAKVGFDEYSHRINRAGTFDYQTVFAMYKTNTAGLLKNSAPNGEQTKVGQPARGFDSSEVYTMATDGQKGGSISGAHAAMVDPTGVAPSTVPPQPPKQRRSFREWFRDTWNDNRPTEISTVEAADRNRGKLRANAAVLGATLALTGIVVGYAHEKDEDRRDSYTTSTTGRTGSDLKGRTGTMPGGPGPASAPDVSPSAPATVPDPRSGDTRHLDQKTAPTPSNGHIESRTRTEKLDKSDKPSDKDGNDGGAPDGVFVTKLSYPGDNITRRVEHYLRHTGNRKIDRGELAPKVAQTVKFMDIDLSRGDDRHMHIDDAVLILRENPVKTSA